MRETRKLSEIRTDGGTQSRIGLDRAKVEEYREAIASGDDFPALVAFYDGTDYWLADGFHRHAAAKLAGVDVFLVDVKQGTRRDAVLYAVGANATHGLPRTADDKRRAVETLLRDEEWAQWSDREIARRCKVSPTFVGKIRGEVVTVHVDSEGQERTYVTRHGTTATMDTSKIGNGAAAYEDIHSLQRFIVVWIGKQWLDDLAKQIEILEFMKADGKHAYWTGLSLDLARVGKTFRKNDLVQAVNNALDSLKFRQSQTAAAQPALSQPSEPAQATPDELATQSAEEVAALMVEAFGLPEETYRIPAALLAEFGENISASALTNNRAHGIVEHDGGKWVCTGGLSQGRNWLSVDAIRAVSRELFAGTVVDYDILGKRGIRGEWFYHGQLIRHKGVEYVLVGPEARFVPDEEQPASEPVPVPAPVLSSEQTQPEPAQRPRIAPYVMGYFQAANEAIVRIATAIPKAQAGDFREMMTIRASLEQMEKRIGSEYDMS